MSKQRIIGIVISLAGTGFALWQATEGNWIATTAGMLTALQGFFPAVHKGES